MKHHIDPKIDCVFKALLGAEDNSKDIAKNNFPELLRANGR